MPCDKRDHDVTAQWAAALPCRADNDENRRGLADYDENRRVLFGSAMNNGEQPQKKASLSQRAIAGARRARDVVSRRSDKLSTLAEKAEQLSKDAEQFDETAKRLRDREKARAGIWGFPA